MALSVHPTTIEQTSKKWKALQLVGGLLAIFGVPAAMLGSVVNPIGSYVGLVLMLGGLGLFVYARLLTWWHHG